MSMKRSKQRTFGGRRDEPTEHYGFGKQPETAQEKSWEEQIAGQPDEAFVSYSLTAHFPKGTLIQHPKFGKGVVLAVDGPRVEVLFSEGKKKLGHAPAK